MKQFEIKIAKGSAQHSVFCTAKNAAIAFSSVVNAYGNEFVIYPNPISEGAPHHCYAEIDASMIA